MATKVCVIGNSHIGSLRLASRDSRFMDAGLAFTFWGVAGKEFFKVKYQSGHLIAPEARVARRVIQRLALDEFDVLIVQGPPLNAWQLLALLRKNQPDLQFYSNAFLRDGIFGLLDRRPIMTLLRQIRADFDGRIFVAPQPLMSERSKLYGDAKLRPAERAAINKILSDYFAGLGMTFVPQPAVTIVDEQYTGAAYGLAAADARYPRDLTHANGLYGIEILKAINAELGNGIQVEKNLFARTIGWIKNIRFTNQSRSFI